VLYAIALTVPVAIAAASVATVRILGLQVPLGATLSLPAALAYLGYGTGLFLLTEEAAWRGVLLPRFQGRIGVLAASLAIGAIWAVWHLPLLAAPGEADHGLPRLPFLLLVVSTSVVVSALTTAARGSVVVAAVFHASFDASYAWSGVVSSQHAMIWVAALLTTGLAVFLGWSAPGRRLWISPSESIGGQQ
jgi:membrane protease YdiL (CAAX protease family)